MSMGEPQPYPMRMAIVEIIGHLIRELACSEILTLRPPHRTNAQPFLLRLLQSL